MNRIIIIGAGQAGGQAAASLRQQKYQGEILLFGDEPHPPYQRPLLSKQYLSSNEAEDRVFLRADKFYQDHNIILHASEKITGIDPDAKSVKTDKGDVFEYDDLILATGSRPRKLKITGSDLKGIYYLRTLDDVNSIKKEMHLKDVLLNNKKILQFLKGREIENVFDPEKYLGASEKMVELTLQRLNNNA